MRILFLVFLFLCVVSVDAEEMQANPELSKKIMNMRAQNLIGELNVLFYQSDGEILYNNEPYKIILNDKLIFEKGSFTSDIFVDPKYCLKCTYNYLKTDLPVGSYQGSLISGGWQKIEFNFDIEPNKSNSIIIKRFVDEKGSFFSLREVGVPVVYTNTIPNEIYRFKPIPASATNKKNYIALFDEMGQVAGTWLRDRENERLKKEQQDEQLRKEMLAHRINQFEQDNPHVDALSKFNLGIKFRNGDGIEKNNELALKWITLAANDGLSDAQLYLGKFYLNDKPSYEEQNLPNYSEAMKWLMLASNSGNAEAAYRIGLIYKNGYGVNSSLATAQKYFLAAHNKGNFNASFELGWIYQTGISVSKSYLEASKYYTNSCVHGLSEACYELGNIFYSGGYGINKNINTSDSFYLKAAELGNTEASNKHLQIDEARRSAARAVQLKAEQEAEQRRLVELAKAENDRIKASEQRAKSAEFAQKEEDDAACKSYGAKAGSQAYVACRMQLVKDRKEEADRLSREKSEQQESNRRHQELIAQQQEQNRLLAEQKEALDAQARAQAQQQATSQKMLEEQQKKNNYDRQQRGLDAVQKMLDPSRWNQ